VITRKMHLLLLAAALGCLLAGCGGYNRAASNAPAQADLPLPPADPTAETIAAVRAIDADGVNTRAGETVTVRGVVTVATGQFANDRLDIYIEDDTGGIAVYTRGWDPVPYPLEIPWVVRVTGVLSQFRGLTQIEPTGMTLEGVAPNPPAVPVVPSIQAIWDDGEPLEGRLIRLRHVSLLRQEDDLQRAPTFSVTDASGAEILLRIDTDTNIDPYSLPTVPFDLAGILRQEDREAPLFEGYFLNPRSTDDIPGSQAKS
jgi:hypothetical protein